MPVVLTVRRAHVARVQGRYVLPVRMIQLGAISYVAHLDRWGWWQKGRSVQRPTTAYPLTASPRMRRLSTDGLWGARTI